MGVRAQTPVRTVKSLLISFKVGPMPFLRLYSPALSIELKRKLAFQLTDAALRGFGYQDEARRRTTIHFVAIEPDDMAVAGELISDVGAPDYTLEVTEHDISDTQRHSIVKELLPVLMQNFGLRKEQRWKINIKFTTFSPSDLSVGGTFLHELESRDSIRLHSSPNIGSSFRPKFESKSA
jgi:phenylpyruvate tautomerase PptA (4-oxalocrotonate tautomerase family)